VDAVYGPDDAVGAEMAGGKWLRKGDYKAVLVPPPFGPGKWQLFNLAEDPAETSDLAESSPEALAELTDAWQQHADEVGVVEFSGEISR
jgi:arylsulfatase